MTTTDEKSAGMPTTGRFGKLRTLAGRVLRRGPVGPEPVRRRAPLPMAPTGECTARWCLAHDHGARPGLAANGARAVAAIAHEAPALLAHPSGASEHATGTPMEMPLGQGVRALLAKIETSTPEVDASIPSEHDAAPTNEPARAAQDVETPSDDASVSSTRDAEMTPDDVIAAGAETTPNDATVAGGAQDVEPTSDDARGPGDPTPDAQPIPARSAATTDDRARDARDRPALIPEVLPPAAHTA